jgi:hypothetical protein
MFMSCGSDASFFRFFSFFRFLGLVGVGICVVSCQSSPAKMQEPLVDVPIVAPIVPVPETPIEPTPQQKAVAALLSDADYALSQNKLLNPINDNAHDRYRSVLLLDPDNERAKLGLQSIALHYVELARAAATRGDLSGAQSMIKYAQQIDPNPVVEDAAVTLRKQLVNMPRPKPYQAGDDEHLLDPQLLKAKDPQVVTQLHDVAKKAQQTGDFVLIVARSDAEGRWIYQQLRSAVPGFLVRGDIKMGQPARVKLVKSLD